MRPSKLQVNQLSKFQIYSQFTGSVYCKLFFHLLAIYSQFTGSVNHPLPPVTDVLSRRMNRHRQELDASREEVVRLSQELDELRADKAILEARVDSMAERLCKCSEGSPRVRGIGSAAAPIAL